MCNSKWCEYSQRLKGPQYQIESLWPVLVRGGGFTGMLAPHEDGTYIVSQ